MAYYTWSSMFTVPYDNLALSIYINCASSVCKKCHESALQIHIMQKNCELTNILILFKKDCRFSIK